MAKTKKELMRELEQLGSFYPEMITWKKADLEEYLRQTKEARSMTLEELAKHVAIK